MTANRYGCLVKYESLAYWKNGRITVHLGRKGRM